MIKSRCLILDWMKRVLQFNGSLILHVTKILSTLSKFNNINSSLWAFPCYKNYPLLALLTNFW